MTIPDSESMVEVGVCDIPCTPEDERRIVTELISEAEANLKEGNLYFVISNRSHTSFGFLPLYFTVHYHLLYCFQDFSFT